MVVDVTVVMMQALWVINFESIIFVAKMILWVYIVWHSLIILIQWKFSNFVDRKTMKFTKIKPHEN